MEAKKQYTEKLTEIKNELSVLNKKLKAHKIYMDKHPMNWSCVGDLGYVIEQLKQINSFLK